MLDSPALVNLSAFPVFLLREWSAFPVLTVLPECVSQEAAFVGHYNPGRTCSADSLLASHEKHTIIYASSGSQSTRLEFLIMFRRRCCQESRYSACQIPKQLTVSVIIGIVTQNQENNSFAAVLFIPVYVIRIAVRKPVSVIAQITLYVI